MTQKHNLVLVGKKDTIDNDTAVQTVAKIFKTTPGKARVLLSKQTLIKKNIDKNVAEHYQKKLDQLGLQTIIKVIPEQAPVVQTDSTSPLSLASEETTTKVEERQAPKIIQQENIANPAKESSQVISKSYQTPIEKIPFLKRRLIDDITGLSLIVGIVTALLGALLWGFIAVSLNIELGWIAIIIGAAIGFSVSTSGGHGGATGILCAILAVIAILLGKVFSVEAIVSKTMDEFRAGFKSEFISAQATISNYNQNMTNEDFINFFHNLSQLSFSSEIVPYYIGDIESLSPQEIHTLRINIEPEIEELRNLDFDDWFDTELMPQIESTRDAMGLSSINLMKQSFDFKDMIFLIFGVVAAFQVGRGNE